MQNERWSLWKERSPIKNEQSGLEEKLDWQNKNKKRWQNKERTVLFKTNSLRDGTNITKK